MTILKLKIAVLISLPQNLHKHFYMKNCLSLFNLLVKMAQFTIKMAQFTIKIFNLEQNSTQFFNFYLLFWYNLTYLLWNMK